MFYKNCITKIVYNFLYRIIVKIKNPIKIMKKYKC